VSERVNSRHIERLQDLDQLQVRRDIQEFVDELIGASKEMHIEYGAISKYPAMVRGSLEMTSLGDILAPLDGYRGYAGQHEVLPHPLYMARNNNSLEEVWVHAWKRPQVKERYVPNEDVHDMPTDPSVLMLEVGDGTTCVQWPGRWDWEHGLLIGFYWSSSEEEVEHLVSITINNKDGSTLPTLVSRLQFRMDKTEDFVPWRTWQRAATSEAEANLMVSTVQDLYREAV
jgi:hypothetical protein